MFDDMDAEMVEGMLEENGDEMVAEMMVRWNEWE
jgi:hypothetical protein